MTLEFFQVEETLEWSYFELTCTSLKVPLHFQVGKLRAGPS
jgi:hypothetical protein